MNKFESFSIRSIPCYLNFEADILANAASNICPSGDFSHNKFLVELIYRSSIPNNITNWRVFEDDEQTINFLHLEDTFKGSVIDDEHHEALLQASALEDKPKHSNGIPKNIIRLEKLFDLCWASKMPNFSLHSTVIHNPYSRTLIIFPQHFIPFIIQSILYISWLIIVVSFVFLMIWKMIELSFTNDGLDPMVTKIPTTLEYFGGIRIRSHEMISTHFDFLRLP